MSFLEDLEKNRRTKAQVREERKRSRAEQKEKLEEDIARKALEIVADYKKYCLRQVNAGKRIIKWRYTLYARDWDLMPLDKTYRITAEVIRRELEKEGFRRYILSLTKKGETTGDINIIAYA